MRICKVWDDDYPWDVRVEKVASALTAAGHTVHLAARNRKRVAPREELKEASVHRLPPWTWAPGKVDQAAQFPAFMNPRWFNHIRRVATEARADVILCRDLPLAPTSVAVARMLKIPVIMDMAENYPAMLASRHSTGRSRPLDFIIRSPRFARSVERWTLRHLDGVLVVVQESATRLAAAGVQEKHIAVVSNTPPLSRLDGPVANQRTPQMKIVYLGIVEAQRGIGTLLDALAIMQKEGHPAQLMVFGDGVDGPHFRQYAEQLGLTGDQVQFRGRVPNAVALAELSSAQVGIVPHWKDESWDTTVPNKLFDYMASGLAVVTSDVIPCERIVRETGAGLAFRDRDAADLARVLGQLQDVDVRTTCASRGRAAIAQTYNWEQDVQRMLSLLDSIVGH